MRRSNSITRRNFVEKTTATTGLITLGAFGGSTTAAANNLSSEEKLPREVWIATVSQMGLKAENPSEMSDMILKILEEAVVFQPDIVCLPEVFATTLTKPIKILAEKVEHSRLIIQRFSSFAKSNKCYLICPVYTTQNGKVYNSAVVLNRLGEQIGEYHKIHPTEDEIKAGISPGSLQPPVFKTDFGIIGIQICFDILWEDGWKALRDQGADIIFWPSAYAGGQVVNGKAWQNQCVVVSSTRKNTSKICDIAGNVVAETGIWDNNLICASVNLEKVFLHSWPYSQRFNEIKKKYGRKIRITNHHEEEWSIVESRSPEIFVKDILREFNLKTHQQHTQDAEKAQIKNREF
jgi:beta-ureidopropionase